MVNSAQFGKRLQKIIAYYGLSATAFSEELSFNRSTISHLLSGRNKPSLEFVMKVLERFPEVELYWLLNGKGTFPTSKIDEKNLTENQKTDRHLIAENSKNASTSSSKISSKENETHKISPVNISEEKQNDLFASSQILNAKSNKTNTIERIVIFYKNGTFKEYKSNVQ